MGNYQSFGDTKIVPRLPEAEFRKILESSKGSMDVEIDSLGQERAEMSS